MKTVISANGAINRDVSPLYVDTEKGEVVLRENARVMSYGDMGINVSHKGMLKLYYAFPIGFNTCVGTVEDKERDQLLFCNYSSNGTHGVYALKRETITALSTGSFWAFNTAHRVSMDVLGDYVYLTDGYNPPRKLNVVTPSTFTLDAEGIQVAMRHPTDAPTVVVGSDVDKVVNKMLGKTFQFATYFVYPDYSYSVLSPYSAIVVSPSVFSSGDTYIDDYIGNYVNITYDLGNADVMQVVLLAREGNTGNWFVVEEYTKPDATTSRTVAFYNDVAREYLPVSVATALYSDVPRLANTNVIAENRLLYGGVTKGYGTDIDVTYDLEVEYEDVDVTSPAPVPIYVSDGLAEPNYYVQFTIPASLNVGDIININFTGRYDQHLPTDGINPAYFYYEYAKSYIVQSGDTQQDVVDYFVYEIYNLLPSDVITTLFSGTVFDIQSADMGGGIVRMLFIGTYNSTSLPPTYLVTASSSVTTIPTGVSTYKSGSWYQVGIVPKDDRSRTCGVIATQKIYIPHAGERDFADAFDIAKIKFTVASASFPSWVTKVSFAVTESVNFAGVYPFVVGNDNSINMFDTFIDGKRALAIRMPENLNYEYASGDYVQLEALDSYTTPTEITETIVKPVIGTRTLLEYGGTEYVGFWLIVPRGTETISQYDGKLASIYRPKSEVSNLVYYEDFVTYDVDDFVAGLEGYIEDGDAWFIERVFEWDDGSSGTITKDQVVEDFYINTDFAIRAYSKGRPLVEVELDNGGEVTLQDVMWSNAYLDNTKTNGTSFFSALNRKQLNERDGVINGLYVVGFTVKAIQDNKETSLYIGVEEVTNADGTSQYVSTGNFLGTTRASDSDYGSRHPASIVKNNRNVYYWDSDKAAVVRSAPNGQTDLAMYRMKKEFTRIAKGATSALFGFDEKYNELVCTFVVSGTPETWVFREGDNMWVEKRDYSDSSGRAPSGYGLIGNQLYALLDGAYKMEGNSSYNIFFGQYKPLSVTTALNVYPTEEKAPQALKMDSNKRLKATLTTPVSNTYPVGQKSYLYVGTWREEDGIYTSEVLKNVLVAGGVEDINQIHDGDDIVGRYVLIKFDDDDSDLCEFRLVTANYTVNK